MFKVNINKLPETNEWIQLVYTDTEMYDYTSGYRRNLTGKSDWLTLTRKCTITSRDIGGISQVNPIGPVYDVKELYYPLVLHMIMNAYLCHRAGIHWTFCVIMNH